MAGEDKGLSLEDIIRMGKTKQLNFFAGMAKGGTAAIVGDLRKSGTALLNMAKEKHEGISRAKSITGTLTVNGKTLQLQVEEEEVPGPLKKALKKALKEAGMPMKVIILLPGGKSDEDDGDEDEAEAEGGEV